MTSNEFYHLFRASILSALLLSHFVLRRPMFLMKNSMIPSENRKIQQVEIQKISELKSSYHKS